MFTVNLLPLSEVPSGRYFNDVQRRQAFNRQHEANIKAYEELLSEKNGRKTRAQRYRQMLKRFNGDRLETAIHSVMKNRRDGLSSGLKGLAEKDQLNGSDEALIIEFSDLVSDRPGVAEHAIYYLALAENYARSPR